MKAVIWVVMKGDTELSRHKSKAIAAAVAHEIGGYLAKYTKE